jgi:AhpD family alkylhydroperoxidase
MPLDEKTKELVALGAALAGNCFPRLRYHFKKCRELGIALMICVMRWRWLRL